MTLKRKLSNRKPFKISYTSRQNWRCNKRGALIHVLKVKEPDVKTVALVLGIAFHNIIDTMYNNVQNGIMDFSVDWLLDNWDMFFNDDSMGVEESYKGELEAKRRDGIAMINNFWEMAKENDWLKKPLMNEKFLSFKYRKYDILAKADIIFDHGDRYEIVDWKTGSAKWIDTKENQQLVQYIVCFKKEAKDNVKIADKKIVSSLVFPLDKKKFSYVLNNSGIKKMLSNIDEIIDIVEKNGDSIDLYDTNPSRDNCFFCKLDCEDRYED